MVRGKFWNEARVSPRTALRLVTERSTLVQLAETVGMIMGVPSRLRSNIDEHRVGV